MESEETKESPFVSTYNELLNLCEKILMNDNNKVSILRSGILGYKKLLNLKPDHPKHVEKLKEVYKQCKQQLINSQNDYDEFLDWFQNTNFVISPKEESKKGRIHLSIIYKVGLRISKEIYEKAENATKQEEKEEYLNNPAAMFPETFILYLLRLFRFCCDKGEAESIINPIIEKLEKALGLKANENPVFADSFSELWNVGLEIAETVGIELPKNSKDINIGYKDVQKAVKAYKSNDNIKKSVKSELQNVLKGVKITDPSNLPEVFNKVFNQMKNNVNAKKEEINNKLEQTEIKI
ncbi:MAG: hypothetical protein QW478_01495 [Candidatus Micrarchaeaceae archaeon]